MVEQRSRKAGRIVTIATFMVAIFFAGFWIQGKLGKSGPEIAASSEPAGTIWTCSMHPQIRQNKPGKCPICGMKLIPLKDLSASAKPVMTFSPEAVKLMEVETTAVQRKPVTAEIKLVGKLDYDQTRVKAISAWSAGRIDRLYVDYEGIEVKKGDHLAELYSPELINAQAELLQALQSVKRIDNGAGLVQRSVRETLEASRDKLRLLGVQPEQIERIEKTGEVPDHLTIYAPIGGVVIEKKASEGMYVQTGTKIYTVADLSKLWLILDAYESDLAWLHYGQDVEFTLAAYPGRVFTAQISFISPVLDDQTRTVKVRAVVDNPDGILKPDLFARAIVKSPLTDGGRTMTADLKGKWICPMHPEEIKDHPGTCDICHMDLVPAESLYNVAEEPKKPPLAVPASAVLLTGRKLDHAVVYVEVGGADQPTFVGREIVLGLRAGDEYIVREGLKEGEKVVTHGNFKIDSAMQIQAKPSMMTMQEPEAAADSSAEPSAAMRAMAEKAADEGNEQTICPVMGNPIDKSVFVEYQGKKVYFCCPSCIDTFLKNPEQYLPKLPQFQTPGSSMPDMQGHSGHGGT